MRLLRAGLWIGLAAWSSPSPASGPSASSPSPSGPWASRLASSGPVDAHLLAEDTARKVATLVATGAVLIADAPTSYYQMAVIAQLQTRGFTVPIASPAQGTRIQFVLTGAGRDGALRADLAVGKDTFWRRYDGVSGKPLGVWTRVVPAGPAAGEAVDEPDQLYTLGRSVEGSAPDRAMRYYRLAFDLGSRDAGLRLGLMLVAQGKAEEGLRYVAAASDKGDPQAKYVLGLAYTNGTGVQRDPVRGRALLQQSAAAGIAAAGQALGQGRDR